MPKLPGVIGALVICAGLDRYELRSWASAYLGVLRAMVRFEEPLRVLPVKEAANIHF
jgi:hypothetical protein